uniref:DUF7044 domain-containing protein n=1 Tax=Glossina palpalis gambiensis TaxID=67801 RepID=A0A1B0C3D9_9MUSC
MEHYPIKYSEHAASRSTAITTQMRATLIYLAPFLHPCKNVVPGIAQVNEQTAHSPTLTAIQARTKQKQEQKEVQQQTTQAVVVVKAVENIVEIPEDNSTAYYTNRSTKNLRERGHRIIQTHTQLQKQMQTHGLNASILKPFAQPSLQLQRKTPCGRCLAIDNCNNGNMRMDTTESNNNDIFNATSSLLLSRCHCLNNTFSNAEDQLQQLQYLQKQHPNINSTAIIDDENADVDVAGVSDYVINGIRNALEQEKRNLPSSTLSTSTSTSTPTSTSFVSTLPSSSLSVSLLSTLSLLVLGSSSAVKRGLNDRKPAAHLNIWLQRMTVVLGCLHLNKTVSVSKWLLMWLLLTMFSSTAHGWVGRNDVPTNCTFPARWEGSWFLSGYQQSIHIKGSQFSYRGRCAASDGNKYLIVDEKGCHRCLVIYEKHKNVLQYKESECEGDSMYMHQSNPSAMAMRSVLNQKNSDHRGGAHPNLNGHSRLSSSDQYIMRSNDDMNDCKHFLLLLHI